MQVSERSYGDSRRVQKEIPPPSKNPYKASEAYAECKTPTLGAVVEKSQTVLSDYSIKRTNIIEEMLDSSRALSPRPYQNILSLPLSKSFGRNLYILKEKPFSTEDVASPKALEKSNMEASLDNPFELMLSALGKMRVKKDRSGLDDYIASSASSTASEPSPEERFASFLVHYATPEEQKRALELILRWEKHLGYLLTKEQVDDRYRSIAKGTELFELPTKCGVPLYPEFQFYKGKVLEGFMKVRRQFTLDVVSPWTIASWCTSQHDELDGGRPIEWIREGRKPKYLQAVAREADMWFTQ